MADPILVSGMRKHPNGEVRHLPTDGSGMSGTSAVGFLREYDEAIANAASAALAAIAAVRKLHSPDDYPLPYCKICEDQAWPCETIDLLNGILGEFHPEATR